MSLLWIIFCKPSVKLHKIITYVNLLTFYINYVTNDFFGLLSVTGMMTCATTLGIFPRIFSKNSNRPDSLQMNKYACIVVSYLCMK